MLNLDRGVGYQSLTKWWVRALKLRLTEHGLTPTSYLLCTGARGLPSSLVTTLVICCFAVGWFCSAEIRFFLIVFLDDSLASDGQALRDITCGGWPNL